MNTNEIVLRKQEITPTIVDMAIKLGEYAWGSQIFGVAKKEAATMIMLRGYELGFSLTASFEYIDVINGRASIKPMGALALINMHPEIVKNVEVEELYDDKKNFLGTRCRIERQDGRTFETSFTLADAANADLVKDSSNWKKYPKNMTRWRAIGFCADLAVPELLGGLTYGMKMGEHLPESDLDTTIEVDQKVIDVKVADSGPKIITLQELTGAFSPDQIMNANNGKIPSTNEECTAIYEKLSAGA